MSEGLYNLISKDWLGSEEPGEGVTNKEIRHFKLEEGDKQLKHIRLPKCQNSVLKDKRKKVCSQTKVTFVYCA